MVIKITTQGQVIKVSPNGNTFTLQELQSHVGGYIEILHLKRVPQFNMTDAIMLLNEEGKLRCLPINQIATDLLVVNYPKSTDVIVGDVLICSQEEIE